MSRMKINPFRYKTSKFFSIFGLFLFFAFIATPTVSYSATITVVDMNDAVSNSVMCTLRDAISAINNGGDNGCTAVGVYGTADTINVPAGTYTITGAANDDANWSGDLDILKAVTITGAGAVSTIIQAGTAGPPIPNGIDRVFHVTVNVPVTFDNITVLNGNVTVGPPEGGGIFSLGAVTVTNAIIRGNTSGFGGNGGGVYSSGALVLTNSLLDNNDADTDPSMGGGFYSIGAATLTNSTVSGNIAFDDGGGFVVSGPLTMTGSTISGNSAGWTSGGFRANNSVTIATSSISNNYASWGMGGFRALGALVMTDSTVSGNTTPRDNGGIYAWGTATFTNSVVSGNSARSTGGIYAVNLLTLTNSTVSNNTAVNNVGGIYALSALTMTDSTVDGNIAGGAFGGVYAGAAVTMINSTISNNTATTNDSGGIYAIGSVASTNSTVSGNTSGLNYSGIASFGGVTLTNSTVSGNTASGSIGGIFVDGVLTMTDTTIYGNVAAIAPGGVYVTFGSVSLGNTIIANNIGGDCTLGGTVWTSTGFNIDSDNSCGLVNPTDMPATNPLVGPLANSGGPTMTHALLPGSPAIDANLACTGSQPVDQRNRARGGDGDNDAISGCDIGAYEASAYGCTDPTATNYDPLAVLDSGRCTYPPAATKSITITVDVTDGQGGKTTKTLKLTPQ